MQSDRDLFFIELLSSLKEDSSQIVQDTYSNQNNKKWTEDFFVEEKQFCCSDLTLCQSYEIPTLKPVPRDHITDMKYTGISTSDSRS